MGGQADNGFGGAAFSPDGSMLAIGREDTFVNLRYAASGAGIWLHGAHTDMVRSVAYAPDGSFIATGSDDALKARRIDHVPRG